MFTRTKKRRAQASGPIELVVAVIILVASMGLAFMVFQNTQNAQCTDKLKSQMRGVEAVMLDVALGSPSTSREADIELATCGGTSIEAIRVVHYDKLSYCGKCPATGSGCWIIEPLSYNVNERDYYVVRDAATCINMPGRVVLDNDDACVDSLTALNSACPENAKQSSEGCGLPASISSGLKLATFGKTPGESIYRMRITKAFDTVAGDPILKMCFTGKRNS